MHLLGSYTPTSAKRDARLGWNKSTITSILTRISEIRNGEQVMSIVINGAALAAALLMLFTVDPAGGQGFSVTAPSDGIVALTPVDPNTGQTVNDVQTLFIEHFKQPESNVPFSLEPGFSRMDTLLQNRSFTNQSYMFSNPLNLYYDVVNTVDAAKVLTNTVNKNNLHVDNNFATDLKQANSSGCNDAAYNWSGHVSEIDIEHLHKAEGLIKRLSAVLTPQKRHIFREAAKAYDKQCLGHLDKIPDTFLHPEYENVVAILQANGVPFCGALRIQSNIFVTARHCFFDKQGRSVIPIEANKSEVEVSVSVLAYPKRKFAVLEKIESSTFDVTRPHYFDDLADYLFLKTEPVNIDMPSIVGKMPSISEELVLIGYYRFHQPDWIFGDPNKRESRENWWYGMRWTTAPLCRIGPINGACLNHFCQTDSGFSGSGMLARSAEIAIVYFGIHIGAIGTHNTCNFGTELMAGNLGIRFDQSVSARILSHNSSEQ